MVKGKEKGKKKKKKKRTQACGRPWVVFGS